MGKFATLAACLLALALFLPLLHAENFVAINSFDGRDVLSGIFYANAKGYPVRFMPVPGGSSELLAAKVGANQDVLLLQSETNPVSGFVEAELRAKGNKVEVLPTTDGGATNLELARRSGAQQFIVVDSAYSDGAISVIPLAVRTHAYVVFADNTNIARVKELLAGKQVTIFGYVDSSVKSELAPLSPKVIGTGQDKYADNVELVRMLMDTYSLDRPIITDGSVIEDSISSGELPILLSGRLVPQVTYDFVKESTRAGKMSGVLLVGDTMVYPVYDMRERIKRELAAENSNRSFGVMVKFAQAIPSAQGGVLSLDMFFVPAYKPRLNITEIVYNRQNGKVMVGLENIGEGPLHYTLELKVVSNGQAIKTFGEPQSRLIERGESAGLEYPFDLSSVDEGAITATAIVKYGASSSSLEEFASSDGSLASISYADSSNVSVRVATYSKEKQQLSVTIKNNDVEQKAYAFTKLTLIDEAGVPTRISGAGIRELEPSTLYVEEFPLILTDKEVELNKEVTVSVDFGGRRGFLNKNAVYKVPLEQPKGESMELSGIFLGALGAAAVLAVLYAIYIFVIRKKK